MAVVALMEALLWGCWLGGNLIIYTTVLVPLLGVPELREVAAWVAAEQAPRHWIAAVVMTLVVARVFYAFGDSGLTACLNLPRPFPLMRTRLRVVAWVSVTAAAVIAGRNLIAWAGGYEQAWPVLAGAGGALAISLIQSRRRRAGAHRHFSAEQSG